MDIEDIPEYEVSLEAFRTIGRIEDLLKTAHAARDRKTKTRLKKESLAVSIGSSLAIEGNGIGIPAVRDIIGGRPLEGPFLEVTEARNAVDAYAEAVDADPWSIRDMLGIHETLMFGLVQCEGFRTFGVGVFEGNEMIYEAPEHGKVPPMMERLLAWGKSSETHPLVKAAVVHCYIEAVHPFEDGNGRMGRLWQRIVLTGYDRTFSMVPVESMILSHRDEYYDVLERCQRSDPHDCSRFLEFMLRMIEKSLERLVHRLDERMIKLLEAIGDGSRTAREIMEAMGLSDRGNLYANYLRPAIAYGLIEMTGAPNSPRQSYRRLLR